MKPSKIMKAVGANFGIIRDREIVLPGKYLVVINTSVNRVDGSYKVSDRELDAFYTQLSIIEDGVLKTPKSKFKLTAFDLDYDLPVLDKLAGYVDAEILNLIFKIPREKERGAILLRNGYLYSIGKFNAIRAKVDIEGQFDIPGCRGALEFLPGTYSVYTSNEGVAFIGADMRVIIKSNDSYNIDGERLAEAFGGRHKCVVETKELKAAIKQFKEPIKLYVRQNTLLITDMDEYNQTTVAMLETREEAELLLHFNPKLIIEGLNLFKSKTLVLVFGNDLKVAISDGKLEVVVLGMIIT